MQTRRDFLGKATTALPLLSAIKASAAEQRMNVVFMVADDMNNALGCFGHPVVRTPNLDRLAARSVRFDHAYCQFPLCAPSRASFLSGRRPATTRVLSLTTPTRKYMQDVVMLPELFRRNGYYSADCGKIFHTGAEHDDPRSWDFVLKESGKRAPEDDILERHKMPEPRNHSMEWDKLRTADENTPDGIVALTAVEHMRKAAAKNQLFFMAVGFRRPHAPYAVPKKYFDLYDPRRLKLPDPGDLSAILPASWYELANQPRLSDKEQREYVAAYYACNSFVDAQAGVVLQSLDDLRLRERTIVVFFGDHGYLTGQHGMWHKMTLYEECARVPLIIHVPGTAGSGKLCSGLVELIDLYPTLAQACGLNPPAGLEGVSLIPQLKDPRNAARTAVYTTVGRNDDRELSHKQPTYFGRSVRTAEWRYTEWDGGKRGAELYHELRDPHEMLNLANKPEFTKIQDKLRTLLTRQPN
ncbi:MAG: sulfatase [Bryobacteraceae bacterium]|nr:sulfatase [Bryobacteraceae bacterium]